jgi:hypothetical protein
MNKMHNVMKESMQPNQQALHDPWKDMTDDLEELDLDYDNGFTQLLYTVSVNPSPMVTLALLCYQFVALYGDLP